ERTGSLDETQIRAVEGRWRYYSELEERRSAILASIAEQGKLTDELRVRLESYRQKHELEDLYLPFRPKRRTRAMIAREKGLEPLAEILWAQEPRLPGARAAVAAPFVAPAKEVPDVEAAWTGARHIVAGRLPHRADA